MIGDHFSGQELTSQIVDRAEPIRQLLSAHIGNFCTKAGLTGLATEDTDPMWLRSILVNSGYFNGESGRLRGVNQTAGAAALYVCRRFRTADAAFASFVTLSRYGVSSMSLIRNPRDNLLYLVGVYSARTVIIVAEDDAALEIHTDEPVDSFIPNISFGAEAESAQHSLGQMTRRSNARDEGSLFHQAVNAHARIMNMPHEVNNVSTYFQAAMDLSRDDHTSSGRLWAYTLLLHFLRGNEDDEAARMTYRRLRAVLNQAGNADRAVMIIDISMVSTWMRTARIFPGDDIGFQRVLDIIEMRPDLAVNVDIAPSATFQRVMTLAQIMERRDQFDFIVNPGRAMASLVIVEQLAIMGPEEEEEDAIDANDVDLDNFW